MRPGGDGGHGADRLHGGQVQVPGPGIPERLDSEHSWTEISEERWQSLDVIYLEREHLWEGGSNCWNISSELSEKVVRFIFLMNDDTFMFLVL